MCNTPTKHEKKRDTQKTSNFNRELADRLTCTGHLSEEPSYILAVALDAPNLPNLKDKKPLRDFKHGPPERFGSAHKQVPIRRRYRVVAPPNTLATALVKNSGASRRFSLQFAPPAHFCLLQNICPQLARANSPERPRQNDRARDKDGCGHNPLSPKLSVKTCRRSAMLTESLQRTRLVRVLHGRFNLRAAV